MTVIANYKDKILQAAAVRYTPVPTFAFTTPDQVVGLSVTQESLPNQSGEVYVESTVTWTPLVSDFGTYTLAYKNVTNDPLADFKYIDLTENIAKVPDTLANQDLVVKVRGNYGDKHGLWSADLAFNSGQDLVAPAPTSFTAKGGLGFISVTIVKPVERDYGFTEIWFSFTNDRAAAVKIAETSDTVKTFSDIATQVTGFAWMRHVDTTGNIGAYFPSSATAGVPVATEKVAASDMVPSIEAGLTSGAPSNLPVPATLTKVDKGNGSADITITWDAYIQGTQAASDLVLYYYALSTPPTMVKTANDLQDAVPTSNRLFGMGLAVSGDGLVLGASSQSFGETDIHDWDSATQSWVLRVATPLAGNIRALSFNGSRAYCYNGSTFNEGSVSEYIYNSTTTSWDLNQTIYPPVSRTYGGFGYSVSITSDGSTLCISEPIVDQWWRPDLWGYAKLYIYTISGATNTLVSTIAHSTNYRMLDASISDDAKTITARLLELQEFGTITDGIITFTESGGVWTEQALLPYSTASRQILSGDGQQIYVSEDVGSSNNEVYSFSRSGNSWGGKSLIILPVSSVNIRLDAMKNMSGVVIAAPNGDGNRGIVYTFLSSLRDVVYTDTSTVVALDSTEYTFAGVPTDNTYRVGIAAVRYANGLPEYTAIVQPLALPDWSVQPVVMNISANVDGVSATDISQNIVDFDNQNNRNASPIVDPVILAGDLTHTLESNGSPKIQLVWSWSGVEAEIDGFGVSAISRANSAPYVFGTTPAEEIIFQVPADARGLSDTRLDVTKYYTIAITAFRKTDPDVGGGLILSNLVYAPDSPYLPETVTTIDGTTDVNDVAASSNKLLGGAPTNSPAPLGVTITTSSFGGRNVDITWSPYVQGAVKADYLVIIAKKTGPGVDLTMSDTIVNVGLTSTSYSWTGLDPIDEYRVGIAAARNTVNGVEYTPIVQPLAAPNWFIT